jgi:hypothetical protein
MLVTKLFHLRAVLQCLFEVHREWEAYQARFRKKAEKRAGLPLERATEGLTTDYADGTDGMPSAKSRRDDRE